MDICAIIRWRHGRKDGRERERITIASSSDDDFTAAAAATVAAAAVVGTASNVTRRSRIEVIRQLLPYMDVYQWVGTAWASPLESPAAAVAGVLNPPPPLRWDGPCLLSGEFILTRYET
jgi:hypothetical protein